MSLWNSAAYSRLSARLVGDREGDRLSIGHPARAAEGEPEFDPTAGKLDLERQVHPVLDPDDVNRRGPSVRSTSAAPSAACSFI